MSSMWGRLRHKITGTAPIPAGFTGTLEPEERVLATSPLSTGEHLVLTQLGIWVPEGADYRRIGWHLISKAAWDRNALLLTESVTTGTAGEAVLLSDLPTRGFVLLEPGTVPDEVRQRVTASIRSSHYQKLPGGGAWFVQRRVPGSDGAVLQVRADPGTSAEVVHDVAKEAAARLTGKRPEDDPREP